MIGGNVFDIETLRSRTGIFADRHEAGQVLAGLVAERTLHQPLVLAIPAGGLPVAVPVVQALHCPLDVAVVSKITLPWNNEAGYGAVAFDGSYRLNEALVESVALTEGEIGAGIEQTRAKVVRRVATLRRQRAMPDLADREVILVDDGLASGFTMLVAVAALRRTGADKIIVAVPTGHASSVRRLAEEVEAVCCANIRGGGSFAVASVYRQWSDVSEAEAVRIMTRYGSELG